MKKYIITVTRTTEYEVTVDETKWDNEHRKDFEECFYDLNPDVEAAAGFAQALAEQSIRCGVNNFIEGFGFCARNEECAKLWNSRADHQNTIALSYKYSDGLYINEIEDDVESEIEDITDKED